MFEKKHFIPLNGFPFPFSGLLHTVYNAISKLEHLPNVSSPFVSVDSQIPKVFMFFSFQEMAYPGLSNLKSFFVSSENAVGLFIDDPKTDLSNSHGEPYYYSTDNFLSFSVCPKSEEELQDNEFIWEIAQKSKLSSAKCSALVKKKLPLHESSNANLFAVLLPSRLYNLLSNISLKEMQNTVHYMVYDIVQGEDEFTSSILDEVPESVRLAVEKMLSASNASISSEMEYCDNMAYITSSSKLLDDALIEHGHPNDSWKIHILTGFTSSCDSFVTFTNDHGNADCDEPEHQVQKTDLVRSLFNNWCLFQSYSFGLENIANRAGLSLAQYQNRKNGDLVESFTKLVLDRKIDLYCEIAHCVMCCAADKKSWLFKVPTPVMEQVILPLVLRSLLS